MQKNKAVFFLWTGAVREEALAWVSGLDYMNFSITTVYLTPVCLDLEKMKVSYMPFDIYYTLDKTCIFI